MADIAKEVGISKGTLYYYYSSKNDLINDIAHRYFKESTLKINKSLQNIDTNSDATKIIEDTFKNILNAHENGKLHLCLIQEALMKNEDLREQFNKEYIKWKNVVEEGLRKILKDKNIDYKVLSNIMVATMDGFVLQSLLKTKSIPPSSIAEYVVKNK